MLSGSIIGDSGESKGVSVFFERQMIGLRVDSYKHIPILVACVSNEGMPQRGKLLGCTQDADVAGRKDLKEIIAIANEATKNERDRCLKAVADEPEVPGSMPDEMWSAIRDDRDAMENAIRIAVQQTKAGIRERILG